MGLVIAARLGSQVEADIAYSALRGAGIEAVLFDNIAPGFASLGAGDPMGRRLMVPESQLEDAMAILSAARPEPAAPKTAEQRISEAAPMILVVGVFAILLVLGVARTIFGR